MKKGIVKFAIGVVGQFQTMYGTSYNANHSKGNEKPADQRGRSSSSRIENGYRTDFKSRPKGR